MEFRIELHPDVPRDPDKLYEWLRKWHAKHNGIITTQGADRVSDYRLTDKGRQLLGLAIGGNS